MNYDLTGVHQDQVVAETTCPVCAAGLGEPCRVATTGPMEHVTHVARYEVCRKTREFDPEKDLGRPSLLEEAIAERNAWCSTAALHLRNEQHFRGQRDAFLREALKNPVIAEAAKRIVGTGWQRLLEP